MLDARFSHLYFYQSLNRLQRGLSAIAELLVYVAYVVVGISLPENERIRHRITDMYADFVQHVDPTSSVIDYLIQHRIINPEVAQQLREKATRQDSCRAMLDKLRSSGNPQAFVVLRKALEQDYPYVVDRIDETTTGAFSRSCIVP